MCASDSLSLHEPPNVRATTYITALRLSWIIVLQSFLVAARTIVRIAADSGCKRKQRRNLMSAIVACKYTQCARRRRGRRDWQRIKDDWIHLPRGEGM